MRFPTIETARLFLRAPTRGDLHWAMHRLSGHAVIATAPLTGTVAWNQMPTLLTHWHFHGWGMFAVLTEGADVPMGLVGPWQPAGWPEPEIGWFVWHRGEEAVGLTAEAAAATVAHAAGALGWREATSFLTPGDAPALAVADLTGALADPFADCAGAIAYRHPTQPIRRAA